MYRKYHKLGLEIVALNFEEEEQAVNLNSWPTTFFQDRNGDIRKVHVGFAAPASVEFNNLLKEEFTSETEGLLAEKAAPSASQSQSTTR